jgi:SulP family sulfate permease
MPASKPVATPAGKSPFDRSALSGDVFGGITAGVVALPLALAFGEASGVGPIAGLWGAIIVGFFAAVFGGTPTQVSGPTGPMIVVFAGVYDSLDGEPGLVFATVVLAGLFQIALGVARVGKYINLVPYPVISGFMSGVGVIIILLQASRLFGGAPDGSGTIAAIEAIPEAIGDLNPSALAIAGLTLGIVFFWPASFARRVPGALVALAVGTVAGQFLTAAPTLGDIPVGLPDFVIPSVDRESGLVIVEGAIVLALLGAIDSLLTSLVADNMTRTRHKSDRELIGQGVGNTIAGLFGAIPGAGATMRTVVNIRSGGRTRVSGAFHSLLLLGVVLAFGPIAERIPHAVLAGILVKVGWDILDTAYIRRAHQGPRWDLFLMIVVLGMTVFVDLITAVIVGIVAASVAFVKQLADEQIRGLGEVGAFGDDDGSTLILSLNGPLSFAATADMVHHVRERTTDQVTEIVLDLSAVPFLDVSGVRAIGSMVADGRDAGIPVAVRGANDRVTKALTGLGVDLAPPTPIESR